MSQHSAVLQAHGGPRVYLAVIAALLALTAITVGVSYITFGSSTVNIVVALSVASIKASLVALYFMHLRHDRPMNAIIFVAGLLFLALFLIFCSIDAGSRPEVRPSNWKPPAGGRATAAAAPAQPAAK